MLHFVVSAVKLTALIQGCFAINAMLPCYAFITAPVQIIHFVLDTQEHALKNSKN